MKLNQFLDKSSPSSAFTTLMEVLDPFSSYLAQLESIIANVDLVAAMLKKQGNNTMSTSTIKGILALLKVSNYDMIKLPISLLAALKK